MRVPSAGGHLAPFVSIVINNYNYERFLRRSIDSALAQSFPNVEVVVVDDASTDGSAAVIHSYKDRIRPVIKTVNAGHAAAFNSGYQASSGDIVMFLDSDDYLCPRAVETVVGAWGPDTAKAQFRLDLVDQAGRVLDLFPAPEVLFDSGDVTPLLLAAGRYETTVTSGNAFARSALAQVMPIPEDQFRQGADGYLVSVVPFFGKIVSIEQSLGAYVQHGGNHSDFSKRFLQRIHWRLEHDQFRYQAISGVAGRLGRKAAPDLCFRDAWHLENRLGSWCLDPASHPFPGESRLALGLHGVAACWRGRLPLRRRLVLGLWFLAAGVLPRAIARHLVAWRLERTTRPRAVQRILEVVRKATS
jgi:glycosyltransferase involved in cell wall biosynthesis